MFFCDKRGRDVIVSGVWPPIPIDKWQLTMDPRKVEEFRKKWKKDMKAALRELDGSVGSLDQATKTQPGVRLEKAAPQLPSPSEFPLDFTTTQQRVRLGKAVPRLPSRSKFPLDLAMKLEERFENDSESGNPIVDESDWAPTTEQKPMKMEKQEKLAAPRPPPVLQGGSKKASHVSPKMMLLKAQHALKERVDIIDAKKTKKKEDRRGVNFDKRKRLVVEFDSDTTAECEAHEEKPASKKKKGHGGKSLQQNAPKKKKYAKANVPPQLHARQEDEGMNQDAKREESPNEARDHGTPHANEPAACEKATSAAEV